MLIIFYIISVVTLSATGVGCARPSPTGPKRYARSFSANSVRTVFLRLSFHTREKRLPPVGQLSRLLSLSKPVPYSPVVTVIHPHNRDTTVVVSSQFPIPCRRRIRSETVSLPSSQRTDNSSRGRGQLGSDRCTVTGKDPFLQR